MSSVPKTMESSKTLDSFQKTLPKTMESSKTLDSFPKTLESKSLKTASKTTSKTLPKTVVCREFSAEELLEMINNPDALKDYGLEIQSVEISTEELVKELEITEDEYNNLLNNPLECIDGETAEIIN